jgi:hypothetical protein
MAYAAQKGQSAEFSIPFGSKKGLAVASRRLLERFLIIICGTVARTPRGCRVEEPPAPTAPRLVSGNREQSSERSE